MDLARQVRGQLRPVDHGEVNDQGAQSIVGESLVAPLQNFVEQRVKQQLGAELRLTRSPRGHGESEPCKSARDHHLGCPVESPMTSPTSVILSPAANRRAIPSRSRSFNELIASASSDSTSRARTAASGSRFGGSNGSNESRSTCAASAVLPPVRRQSITVLWAIRNSHPPTWPLRWSKLGQERQALAKTSLVRSSASWWSGTRERTYRHTGTSCCRYTSPKSGEPATASTAANMPPLWTGSIQ